jgi:Ala-tRNA(Pro) deacylase
VITFSLRNEARMRITDYLTEQQVSFEAFPHPPAFSAQKLAKYLRVKGGLVAKAVLLHGPAGYFLAVLPATHRLDLDAISSHQGGPVRLADADELTRIFTDCEWGTVCPFGNLYGVPTLLDASMTPDMWIVFEAGSHVESIRLGIRDFERLAGPVRLAFACQGD